MIFRRRAALALLPLALLAGCASPKVTIAHGRPLAGSGRPAAGASAKAGGAGQCRYVTKPASDKAIKDVGTPPPAARAASHATMKLTTATGAIVIDLDAKGAPCAVGSFAYLAGKHFFDNTPCHRLTTEGIFVLQCGDPSGTGYGGPAYDYDTENLGAKYTRGTVAVANAGQPTTSGSQFFISYRDNSQLPADYTMLGTVTSGMELVDQVAAGGIGTPDATGPGSGAPKTPFVLQQVTVAYN